MLDRPRADQYSVVTRSHGRPPSWRWEIQRRPRELGIKLYGTDFKTEAADKLAGEKALVAFLDPRQGGTQFKRPHGPSISGNSRDQWEAIELVEQTRCCSA